MQDRDTGRATSGFPGRAASGAASGATSASLSSSPSASPSSFPGGVDPNLITLTPYANFTIVKIHAEPANVLTLNLWRSLAAALSIVEANPSQHGIGFISTLKKPIFSAGNDIQELYAPNTSQARYKDFWLTSNTFLIDLYTSRLVTVAGIKGACPAGGCAISVCCDIRIMTSNKVFKSYIGLNEVALGIHVPKFWAELMRRTASKATGSAIDRVLLNATLMSSEQAFAMGLVDEMIDDESIQQGNPESRSSGASSERALEERVRAVLEAETKGRSDRVMAARHGTKLLGREDFVRAWRAYLEQEAVLGWHALAEPATVAMLKSVLTSLQRSKL